MPKIEPTAKIKSYFENLFKILYNFDLEFSERKNRLIEEGKRRGGDDFADINERKIKFIHDHFAQEDPILGFMRSLTSAPHSIWKEGNTQNLALYHCPGTDFYTLTFNETKMMIPSVPGQIATMIPSLKYIDFVAPQDGEIVIVQVGREEPEWLDAFESFHGEETTATGPRLADIEKHNRMMEQLPMPLPAEYPSWTTIPDLPSFKDLSFYRSIPVDKYTLIEPTDLDEFENQPIDWHNKNSCIFWAISSYNSFQEGEGVILPSSSDAFYFFLMVVIPRICLQQDRDELKFAFSEHWQNAVSAACEHARQTGNARECVKMLGEALEQYFLDGAENEVRAFHPTFLDEYLDLRFKDFPTDELAKDYGLTKNPDGWQFRDWSLLKKMVDLDALDLPEHGNNPPPLPFGTRWKMFGRENLF